MRKHPGQLLRKAPLLIATGAMICAILGLSLSPIFTIAAVILSLIPWWVGMKSLSYFCLIISLMGALREAHCERAIDSLTASITESNEQPVKLTGSVVRVLTNSVWIQPDHSSALVEASFPEDTSAHLGERWEIEGRATLITPPTTPGAFDRYHWLRRQHVAYHLDVLRSHQVGEGNGMSRLRASSETLRDQAAEILFRGAPQGSREAGVVVSLMFGDKRFLPQDDYQTFRESGCLHIFAVSGMHIGMVFLILLFLAKLLPIRPNPAKLLCIPLLGLYVFVTGMPVSAIRAFLMISLLIVGSVFRKNNESLNTLSLAAIITLLWDPFQLGDPGFQLSFLIFAALICTMQIQPSFVTWGRPDSLIPTHCYTKWERWRLKSMSAMQKLLIMSLACWAVAMPITAYHFGTINLYSPLTGLLMTIFLAPLMCSALLSIALSWIPSVAVIINFFSRLIASVLLAIASWVADLPYPLVSVSLPAGSGEAVIMSLPTQQSVTMLGNHGLLINGGNSSDARFRTIPALKYLGFTPKLLLQPTSGKNQKGGSSELQKEWASLSILDKSLTQTLTNSSGSTIRILTGEQPFKTGLEADNAPIVRWEYANHSLLYLGNAAFSLSQSLPADQLKADVLVIGWHRHDPYDMADWIALTGARYVIILNGREEDRLTPDPEATYRMYRLCDSPTLLIKMRESGVEITPWQGDSR